MRIALINSRLSLFGGLETRLFNYINYFSQKGDEVYVIVYKADKNIKLPPHVTVVNLNLKWYPRKIRKKIFNKKVNEFLKSESFEFSLSMGRTFGQDAVLAPATHLGYMKYMNITNPDKNDKQQIDLDTKSYEGSSLIFACSAFIKNELLELYQVPEQKVKVLYPPLNVGKFNRQFENQRDILRRQYTMANHEKTFAFVSTGHRRKGLELLLEIFKNLSGTENILYIAGSPEVKSTSANIRYIGFEKETNKLFSAADFLIHPAFYEPFGQIVSESLACGTPVIISSNVGAKEIINEKNGLVVNHFNISDWVEIIKNVHRADFEISRDFVEQHKLSTRNHLETMLDYFKKMNQ